MKTDYEELADGASDSRVANITHTNRCTVNRWRRSGRLPWCAARTLAAELHGAPPILAGPGWARWRFRRDGLLYAPDLARGFSPGDLYQLHWLQQGASWRTAQALRCADPGEVTLPPQPAPADAP